MSKQLGISIGFVTNSSSMVYHFPRILLENPDVKAFVQAFEIADGFVGEDLWYRSECGSFATTKEQKEKIARQLVGNEYCDGPAIDVASDSVVVVYGDEYNEMANILAKMLKQAASKAGLKLDGAGYN